jgi:hypothetical protein
MRYKIDPPEGYVPNSVRRNSKNSLVSARGDNTIGGSTGQGGTVGDAFSHTNSASTTQLPNTASNTSLQPATGGGVTNPKQLHEKRISSAPPPAAPPATNRPQKIYSRNVSVPKLFGEIAHLDNELQVSELIFLLLTAHLSIGSFRIFQFSSYAND